MGNTCTCFERGTWDAHCEITKDYVPRNDVYQDMTKPLSHYFVSSGHNSYLKGDQLFSSSGTATIAKCLDAGCRVIELDVYNGPICKHGGTLTSSVGFKECVEAIRDHAFTSSPYPVILTMENHADVENQATMAAILRDVLGDRLFVPKSTDVEQYASPEELKNLVVCRTSIKKSGKYDPGFLSLIYIRNKKFTTLAEMLSSSNVGSSSFEEFALPQWSRLRGWSSRYTVRRAAPDRAQPLLWCAWVLARVGRSPALLWDPPPPPPPPPLIIVDISAEELGAEADEKKASEKKEKVMKKYFPSDALKERLKSQDNPEDAVVDKAIVAGSLQELYTYSSKHLLRAYPALWRVTSSNYNPMYGWIRGVSLAALNWQVWDKALWCNEGKFLDNGGCGYVLKPDWMRQPDKKLPSRPGRKLVVHVYSAHKHQGRSFLIFKDDLFIKLTLWGMPVDKASHSTKTAHDTGRLRVEQDFEFTVRYPEMAVLCIALMDDDSMGSVTHAPLGYYALPLSTLQEGNFRIVLKNPSSGRPLNSTNNPARDTWVKVRLMWADEAAQPLYSGDQP